MFPELSTEEEEEDEDSGSSSSDEFTDSIEEDDDRVTARRLASEAVRGVPPRSHGKELEEAEKSLEGNLEGTGLHPEEDGFTSVVQMRYRRISALPLRSEPWSDCALSPS